MGTVHPGAPFQLISLLHHACGVSTFVETGTYLGETAARAAAEFTHAYSIEFSDTIYRSTRERLGHLANLTLLQGDSRVRLGEIVQQLDAPALFWLDAHWSGGATYGAQDECPLLEEINIINRSPQDHFILIDDAQFFLAPPPAPHNTEQWPTIVDVIAALRTGPFRKYIVIHQDVIIAVPQSARGVVIEYCRQQPPTGAVPDHRPPAWRSMLRRVKSAIKRLRT